MTSRNWLQIALTLITAVNIGLGISYLGLWGVSYSQHLDWRADFTAYYTGWFLVSRGFGDQLYDYQLQMSVQQEILQGKYLADGLLAFNYPPHVALIGVPLALVSRQSAYVIWSVIQVGFLIWMLHLTWRELGRGNGKDSLCIAFLAAIVALPALLSTLLLGAFSLFLVICLLKFALHLERGEDERAAFWFLLTTMKPQVAIVPALILVVARRWRGVRFALVGGLVIFLICSIVLGFHTWYGFVESLLKTFHATGDLGVDPSHMHNLRGFLHSSPLLKATSPSILNITSLLLFLMGLTLIVRIWRQYNDLGVSVSLLTAVSLALGTLLSLHLNPQDTLFWTVPAILFYKHKRILEGSKATAALDVVVFALPILFLFAQYGQSVVSASLLTVPVFGLLVYFMMGQLKSSLPLSYQTDQSS